MSEATKVLNAVKRIGGYQSIQFNDPVTAAVVQEGFGGWPALCRDLLENGAKGGIEEQWFLKDFAKMYSAFIRQNRRLIGHLPGVHEISNTALGYQDEEHKVVLINDGHGQKQIGG
jgi:hypothetical protein